jgi:hypothetical protein
MSPPSAEVKEWVQLHFYSPLVPSLQVTQLIYLYLVRRTDYTDATEGGNDIVQGFPNIGLRLNTRPANIKQPKGLDTNKVHCITITTDTHVNRTARRLAGICRGGTEQR